MYIILQIIEQQQDTAAAKWSIQWIGEVAVPVSTKSRAFVALQKLTMWNRMLSQMATASWPMSKKNRHIILARCLIAEVR